MANVARGVPNNVTVVVHVPTLSPIVVFTQILNGQITAQIAFLIAFALVVCLVLVGVVFARERLTAILTSSCVVVHAHTLSPVVVCLKS